jgi:hypothetical protein
MVLLGQAAQRLMKYMKFAFEALPRPARKAHMGELTRLHGAHVGLVTNAVRKCRPNGRHLKNGETNIRLSCYPSHALGDNRPQ